MKQPYTLEDIDEREFNRKANEMAKAIEEVRALFSCNEQYCTRCPIECTIKIVCKQMSTVRNWAIWRDKGVVSKRNKKRQPYIKNDININELNAKVEIMIKAIGEFRDIIICDDTDTKCPDNCPIKHICNDMNKLKMWGMLRNILPDR